MGKRNVIIDIEFLRMDKYDEYKAIEDTLARIMELKAKRDQTADPAERRRIQSQIRDLQYQQFWRLQQIWNRGRE